MVVLHSHENHSEGGQRSAGLQADAAAKPAKAKKVFSASFREAVALEPLVCELVLELDGANLLSMFATSSRRLSSPWGYNK